jgi:hypothetical protein
VSYLVGSNYCVALHMDGLSCQVDRTTRVVVFPYLMYKYVVCMSGGQSGNEHSELSQLEKRFDIHILNINFPITFIVPCDFRISRHPLGTDYDLVFEYDPG